MKIRKMKKNCKMVLKSGASPAAKNDAYDMLYGVSMANFLKRRGVDLTHRQIPKNTDTSNWRYKKKFLPRHMVRFTDKSGNGFYGLFTHFTHEPVLVGEITKR